LAKFRPSAWRFLHQVGAVVEQTRIARVGDRPELVLIDGGLHDRRQELVEREQPALQGDDPAVVGELRRPYDVESEHVVTVALSLQVGRYLSALLVGDLG
jgi:hypothetical protein